MPGVPQGAAKKGSQKWLQILINDRPELLDQLVAEHLQIPVDEDIQWLSPLKKDNYAEYRNQSFLRLLDAKLDRCPLEDFWPRGGPQWDALGRSRTGRLFLVEAKSHIQELLSTLKARDAASQRKIQESLAKTREFLNASNEVDWTRGFYQYCNRLSHLYLLRHLNGLPAYLILIGRNTVFVLTKALINHQKHPIDVIEALSAR